MLFKSKMAGFWANSQFSLSTVYILLIPRRFYIDKYFFIKSRVIDLAIHEVIKKIHKTLLFLCIFEGF